MIVEAFALSFRQRFPDLAGVPLLVALSGGSDSVALLHLMDASHPLLGCGLRAAHVHHHVRGADADADASFCASLCAGLGVPLDVVHASPHPPRGVSPEAWWRRERYRLLEQIRVERGCAALLTAHTRDDQAETVLLKLFRGAGPRGVGGIRRRRGTVARPLLDLARADLRAWLGERGEDWREDATNDSSNTPRGRIRHRLLPAVEEAFAGVAGHLGAFADALVQDEEVLAGLLRREGVWPEPCRAVPMTRLSSLPMALRRRWVLELASRLPLAEPPSRQQLDAVEGMIGGTGPAAVDLGRRWVLRRRGGRLLLSPPPCGAFDPVPVEVPSEAALPGGFVARLGGVPSPAAHGTWLCPEAVESSLAWRSPRPGEAWGGERRRPLAGLLARAGVPAEWRRAWPVLTANGRIVWVPGVSREAGWAGRPGRGVRAELEEPWRRLDRS